MVENNLLGGDVLLAAIAEVKPLDARPADVYELGSFMLGRVGVDG